jgi:hypothetical protein
LHLLEELHGLDRWSDWGIALTKSQMMQVLRDHDVIGAHPVRIRGVLCQGWYRRDFEQAWQS